MRHAVGDAVSGLRNVRIVGPGSELLPEAGPMDLVLSQGRILDIAPAGFLTLDGPVLDGDGCWLVPGLWDHHVHVVQWALAAERVKLGHAESAAPASATRSGPTNPHSPRWTRGRGRPPRT
jgi:dihydroorotase-like cyclic amidohydrolase